MPEQKLTRRFLVMALCVAATSAYAYRHYNQSFNAASAVAGQFDYYLLSLSWSPSYCLTHQEDRAQCSKGFGFVLHGLWPQNSAGGYPENCAPGTPLPAEAAALGRTLFPSSKLMQHEWQRHGTCSGMEALSFFRSADRALALVKVPPAFDAPRSGFSMSAAEIKAAFRSANPLLQGTGLTVACNRDELAEVRVCLSKELAFVACGRGVRNSCPDVDLRVPAAR